MIARLRGQERRPPDELGLCQPRLVRRSPYRASPVGGKANRNQGSQFGGRLHRYRFLRPPPPLPIAIILDQRGEAGFAHAPYPLIAPAMIPSMKRRWKRRKMITIGRVPMKEPAITAPYSWL